MKRTHAHPCRHCEKPVPCSGNWEQNYDGWPDAICPEYHLATGEIEDVLCEDCEDILCPLCLTNERPVSEYGPRYRRCSDCEDGDDGRTFDDALAEHGRLHDPTHPDNLETWRLKH